MVRIINWCKPRWRLLIVLLTPLVLLPIPLIGKSPQARCGYIVLILTIYWVFEAIPLPVTSLLPLALFPMAGILPAEIVAPHYFKDIITLFFGSMALAFAVESVNLHRRIALFVLSLVGTSTKWSMAGLMAVTAFLSMWINNSAATSIMLPVALAITNELESHTKGYHEKKNAAKEAASAVNETLDLTEVESSIEHVIKGIVLNPLHLEEPFFQFRTDPESQAIQADLKLMLLKQYHDLGRPKWSEISVAIVFCFMILLWVTKDFSGSPGWDVIFRHKFISDGTVAIFCGVLPLILPNANPLQADWKYEPIIRWNDLAKHMPWGALILLGAGLVVASAFQASQLSESVAHALKFLSGIPRAAVILLVIIISGFFTEVTSNLSTASIFFPVLDSVGRSSGIHPAFLILPCTLAVSLAFMLPIATPPNAIVFGSGALRVIDMVKAGIVMNIMGFLVIFFAATTWMPKIYGLTGDATNIFFSLNTTVNPGFYNGTE
ncbi:unnamed protein product [Adineta steineri]|uniref:Uncharacterized protein n=1 Tax=Adineta steineri TaxID=433720 RepID=A0A814WC87_9BILA|nr:unnamed protein product [Adineta steineri]